MGTPDFNGTDICYFISNSKRHVSVIVCEKTVFKSEMDLRRSPSQGMVLRFHVLTVNIFSNSHVGNYPHKVV